MNFWEWLHNQGGGGGDAPDDWRNPNIDPEADRAWMRQFPEGVGPINRPPEGFGPIDPNFAGPRGYGPEPPVPQGPPDMPSGSRSIPQTPEALRGFFDPIPQYTQPMNGPEGPMAPGDALISGGSTSGLEFQARAARAVAQERGSPVPDWADLRNFPAKLPGGGLAGRLGESMNGLNLIAQLTQMLKAGGMSYATEQANQQGGIPLTNDAPPGDTFSRQKIDPFIAALYSMLPGFDREKFMQDPDYRQQMTGVGIS